MGIDVPMSFFNRLFDTQPNSLIVQITGLALTMDFLKIYQSELLSRFEGAVSKYFCTFRLQYKSDMSNSQEPAAFRSFQK